MHRLNQGARRVDRSAQLSTRLVGTRLRSALWTCSKASKRPGQEPAAAPVDAFAALLLQLSEHTSDFGVV